MKQQKMVEKMYKYKRLFLSYKHKLPQVSEKIMELKQRQDKVST